MAASPAMLSRCADCAVVQILTYCSNVHRTVSTIPKILSTMMELYHAKDHFYFTRPLEMRHYLLSDIWLHLRTTSMFAINAQLNNYSIEAEINFQLKRVDLELELPRLPSEQTGRWSRCLLGRSVLEATASFQIPIGIYGILHLQRLTRTARKPRLLDISGKCGSKGRL